MGPIATVTLLAMPADRLEGVSPEGLATTVPLASVGSRAIAGSIDLLIQGLLVWIAFVAFKGTVVGDAITAVLIFVVIFFLPIAFEMLDNGRGPGRRIVGLRVVTLRGGPIGFRASAIRNLLRVVDFLPSGYLTGMGAILSTTTGQRIGDIAAGTVVSFVPGRRTRKRKKQEQERLWGAEGPPWRAQQQAQAARQTEDLTILAVDAVQITKAEIGLVHSYLARREQLPADARARLSADIASRLRPKVVGIPIDSTDDEFLELLAAVKSLRR